MTETSRVRINDAYRNYTPPVDVSAIVCRLLHAVPDKYLRGLDCIVLTNAAGVSRRDREGSLRSRDRKISKSSVRGLYHHGSSRNPPYIELRVDKIISDLNGKFLNIPLVRIPLVRELAFGHVLYHELGHHIHHEIRPEYAEKEDVADDWARKLIGDFIRKRYRYALPILVPASKIYRYIRRKQ